MRPVQINVVLVRTLYDSNIGSTSRAMANMGAERLILIDRKCELTLKAHQSAASGQAGLENKIDYASWEEFFKNEPDGIRLSFSARDGKARPLWDAKKLFTWLNEEEPKLSQDTEDILPVYLVFGPEDWGLSNTDIEHCHFNVNIPTYGNNSSLNLSQAVLVALYILRDAWGGKRTILEGKQPNRFSQKKQTVFPDKALKQWITEMGFSVGNRNISAYSVMRRMLLHNVPSAKELRILEIVLQQSIRKLREYNTMFNWLTFEQKELLKSSKYQDFEADHHDHESTSNVDQP